jgi:hypothetical protein
MERVMQESCLDCYRKHVSKANVFENEANLGYPLHKYLACGELACAEDEVVKEYPVLANLTREHRIKYCLDDIPIPTLDLIQMSLDIENFGTEENEEVINTDAEGEE